ncbi:hypothetical protein BX600DRAFT_429999 [Xylariales sp. PMI_506]|nr:hypothetical protein BX600DRAFT_429999 [Xylariales sp. PMI_506]
MANDQSATTELFTLMGVGMAVILLRTYARWQAVGFGRFEADDYLMIVAMGIYAAESAMAYKVVSDYDGLANNGMTDEQRASLDPNSTEYLMRVGGSKTQVIGWSLYALLLWVLKACMCTLFLRLTQRLGNYRTRINVGFGVIAVTYIVTALGILLGCTPISKNWQIYPNPGVNCQPALSRVNIFVTLALNVATDVYLLTIPLPMLWAAHIKPWKKVGLIVLFSGGIFVMMAGILRCVLILANDVTGAQDGSAWAVRETFVAVVTSNLPLIFPLLRTWLGSWVGQFSSNKDSRPTGVPHGSIPLPDRSWKGNEEFTNNGNAYAFTGSRERIIEPPVSGIKVEMDVKVQTTTRSAKERTDSDSDI